MKAILPLYLTGSLGFNQNRATTLIHSFNFSAYFFTLFGGIISDSWLGRFKTILVLSLVYCGGMTVLAGSAFPVFKEGGGAKECFLIGLTLVAFGTGGIKPCVSAFGGDQFHPSQVTAISTYFSIFYFAINAGSVLSMFITPIMRQNVHCFGENNCYPLAFGLPAVLMLIATVVFVAGSRMYVKKPASSDATSLKVIKVLSSAFIGRIKSFLFKNNEAADSVPKDSWLEYADTSKYSRQFVHETRIVLGILTVFTPISLFWALYDQQGSRWTYQAIMMNGKIGPITIKPEQMGVFNAILILLLIPTFDRVIYPMINQFFGLSLQPLAKIFWGMILATSSFILAALLQFLIDSKGTFIDNPVDAGTLVCTDGCVHVLWQFPQYFILTCGEVMLSITGLEFAYSQAPESMKAVCSAAWLLTVAVGNFVVIFFNEINLVTWFTSNHQMAWNFVFWAGILGFGAIGFTAMASKYKYVNSEEMHTVSSSDEQYEEEAFLYAE